MIYQIVILHKRILWNGVLEALWPKKGNRSSSDDIERDTQSGLVTTYFTKETSANHKKSGAEIPQYSLKNEELYTPNMVVDFQGEKCGSKHDMHLI
jgi:hypothetical protein